VAEFSELRFEKSPIALNEMERCEKIPHGRYICWSQATALRIRH